MIISTRKKLLAILTVVIIVVAAVIVWQVYTTQFQVAAWTLNFSGGKSVNMTDIAFKTAASEHAATWTNTGSETTWKGAPLYQLVNWYVDSGKISTGALSLGYNVTVIGSDGYSIILDGNRVQANDNIIVANEANGTILSDKYYPLTLTGSNLTRREGVKGIAQIQIKTVLLDMTLTIKGSDGTTVVLNTNDIAALPTVSAMGGLNMHGSIKGVGTYTGISIKYLCDIVGGMPDNSFVRLTASDTYTKDFTYEQVMSGTGYATYDPLTNNETAATQPLTPILAYAVNGTLLSSSDGPLRSAFVGPEGLLTLSSTWVKSVIEVDVVQVVA